ncbi:MAG: pilus assembly protein PilM [Deltaproteobacteria bacterium]|nr:pilus assembly protein PilM [Deltaproteobacteria bacterium]
MAQHLAAIDIGGARVRVALIEASLRKAELVSAFSVAVEPGQDRAALWAHVRESLPPRLDAVVVTVDGATASTRLLSFPFDDLRRVESAVPFELENLLPYELEEVATTWSLTRRGQAAAEVLTAVTPRAALAKQIDELKAAGLEPRAMVLPAAALAELVSPADGGPVAVLSVGESQSHLAVIGQGLRFARTLRTGGIDVDRALAAPFKLSPALAKEAKEKEARIVPDAAAASDEARVSQAVSAGLAPLVRELAVTFRALPAEALPAKVLLTGGLSRLPGLAAFLEARLGVPVELVDIRARLGTVACRPESLGPEHAVSVAMALALLNRGRSVALNFRRGELAYRGDLQVYRGEVIRIGVGIAAVILLAIAGSIVRYTVISAEEARLDRSFCEVTKKIVGQEICDPTRALATLRQAPTGGDGIVVPPYSAAAVLDMVSRTIDSSIDVTFDELEVRVDGRVDEPDRVTARGEAATFETTEQIVARLQKHACVRGAEVSKQKKSRDGTRVEFSLTAKVSCPPGVQLSQLVEVATMPAAPGAPPQQFMPPPGEGL